MPDRSENEMPTQTLFARMTGYYPSATPRYNDAAKTGPITRPLVGNQKNLPEKIKKAILDAPIKRMKFCGGMSKAYKK